MPCLAQFFDTMSGVKKLTNIVPAINCPISANEASLLKRLQYVINNIFNKGMGLKVSLIVFKPKCARHKIQTIPYVEIYSWITKNCIMQTFTITCRYAFNDPLCSAASTLNHALYILLGQVINLLSQVRPRPHLPKICSYKHDKHGQQLTSCDH